MKKITEVDLNNIIPNTRKFDLVALSDEAKNNYLLLSSIYRDLFIQYICNKLNLTYYDNVIKNSENNFVALNENKMDFYQLSSSTYLKYFYIRNNIYIENLSSEELNSLKNIVNLESKLDEKVAQFIENTYKKVIFEDTLQNGEKCMVFYGPQSINFSCPNDFVVIGFRYDEFYSNNMTDEEWDILHDKQRIFLNTVLKEMEEKYNQDEISVKIIKYNDFNVLYKNNDELNFKLG